MEPASWGAIVVRVVLASLGVGLLAAVVLRWAVSGRRRPGRALRVLDRLALERGRTLYLVEAPGKALVLASDAAGTRVLAELDAEAVAAALARTPEPDDRPWWLTLVRPKDRE